MKFLSKSAFARVASSVAASLVATVAVSTATTAPAAAQAMIYNLTTQNQLCTKEQHGPYGGTSWQSTLNLNIDRTSSYHGHIVAYHYKTFASGQWTNWYVPGYNDIASKIYAPNNALERMWSIFQDHTHEFIICR